MRVFYCSQKRKQTRPKCREVDSPNRIRPHSRCPGHRKTHAFRRHSLFQSNRFVIARILIEVFWTLLILDFLNGFSALTTQAKSLI